MKNLLTTGVLLIMSIYFVFAKNISIDEAETVAVNFITEKNYEFSKNTILEIDNSYSVEYNGEITYHVINFLDGGFVIVSAEDQVRPILGYSYTTSCPEENQSPSFVSWMQQYSIQIEKVRKNNFSKDSKIQNEWTKYLSGNICKDAKNTKELEPILTSIWNQDIFYNEWCPDDPAGPGGHAFAGCVATAIGQVMNYYRHPINGVSSYTYDHPEYGTQSVDFSAQTYNWDAMGTEIAESNEEIAKLLYHIGVSVDMNYGPGGSGMYNHKGAYTMRTYFDYLDETRYYFRDSVDASFDWVDTLIMHLDNGMPLYYAGWSDTIFVSGHAFVCDGYQDTVYFHFNFGWGGAADGYFNVDGIVPGGADFTLCHEMIAYSYPKTNYPHYCNGLNTLFTTRGAIDDGSGPLYDYETDLNCEWLIAPDDSVSSITLDFIKFDLDVSDYLTVFDGADETAPVLGTFTGNTLPASLTGTADRMFLRFTSDAATNALGFLVEYTCSRPEYCTFSYDYFTDPTGTISDGSNGYDYFNDEYCRWRIQPTGATNILITFTMLDIEAGNDNLRIYDVTNSTLIQDVSGNTIPEPILVYTDDIKLSFTSDISGRADGWELYYESNVTAIPENEFHGDIAIYPNPADNVLNIHIEDMNEKAVVNIYDVQGRLLLNQKVNNSLHSIDINELKKGMYLLKIAIGDQVYNEKVIIN